MLPVGVWQKVRTPLNWKNEKIGTWKIWVRIYKWFVIVSYSVDGSVKIFTKSY